MSMRCEVCLAPRPPDAGSICPRCGWDADSPWAKDANELYAAREAYKARVQARPTGGAANRTMPWIVVGIGVVAVLFVLISWRSVR
jgi:hypothetical protein